MHRIHQANGKDDNFWHPIVHTPSTEQVSLACNPTALSIDLENLLKEYGCMVHSTCTKRLLPTDKILNPDSLFRQVNICQPALRTKLSGTPSDQHNLLRETWQELAGVFLMPLILNFKDHDACIIASLDEALGELSMIYEEFLRC
jgi:hypothetical protein